MEATESEPTGQPYTKSSGPPYPLFLGAILLLGTNENDEPEVKSCVEDFVGTDVSALREAVRTMLDSFKPGELTAIINGPGLKKWLEETVPLKCSQHTAGRKLDVLVSDYAIRPHSSLWSSAAEGTVVGRALGELTRKGYLRFYGKTDLGEDPSDEGLEVICLVSGEETEEGK